MKDKLAAVQRSRVGQFARKTLDDPVLHLAVLLGLAAENGRAV
jgi:DnaJ-domain-containing protein 1